MKREIKNNKTDLCDSCQACSKASGYGKEVKLCHTFDQSIRFPVEKCSSYQPKGQHSIYELQEMAVYIEKKKDSAGFKFYKNTDGQQIEFK